MLLTTLVSLALVHVPTGRETSLNDFALSLPPRAIVVLAEKHDTPHVQRAQAALIEAVRATRAADEPFTVGWEFVDHSRAAVTEQAWAHFKASRIDGPELLRVLGVKRSTSYLPVLEATRAGGGVFTGVNLTRAQKAPVVEGGITKADPALVPAGYERGSPAYLERFAAAMGEHAPAEKLQNYFDAQCLTDDVMAWQLHNATQSPLKFLVVGSFHADFNDGVVARLRVRDPSTPVIVVRFADAADGALPARDPKYGDIADYVLVAPAE